MLRVLTSILVVLGATAFPVMVFGQMSALPVQDRLVELFRQHESSIVRVKAVYRAPEGEELPQVVIGSGFFISREGLILTNASIVSDPIRVWIEHHNIAYSADVIGTDIRSNVALLRTHSLPENFSFFHLADSPELPPIGSFILRLSMPLELQTSPYLGIVSGYESRFGDRFFPCTYIRTSIPAGPGDGGAAYLDLSGKLLGIQVGSVPEIGSSYILPSRAALRIRDDLLFSGEVTYGWVGFEVDEQSSIKAGRRVILTEIFPETPAAEAGLLPDDVLVQVGAYTVRTLDDLRNAMFYTRVGQFVDIRVLRDEAEKMLSVKLAERPADEPLQIVEPAPAVPMADAISPLKNESGGEADSEPNFNPEDTFQPGS